MDQDILLYAFGARQMPGEPIDGACFGLSSLALAVGASEDPTGRGVHIAVRFWGPGGQAHWVEQTAFNRKVGGFKPPVPQKQVLDCRSSPWGAQS